ncbi:MAG: hypothetical protein A2076_15085 [Geobacteraceae bacterium GWC2_53_11]|nr:MAG: hypothetical protein A2076_15085 [Geobacteraceae bacterium GWC2_53_11]
MLKEIRLEPLQPEHCHEMVSYILDSPREQTTSLSDFISTLSEGNPLFISESLSYLHNEKLLFMDEGKQWRWDMEKIRQSDMPTTVVSLFGSKIRKLSPELIDLLEQCACMGNSFSPAELSAVRGVSLRDIFHLLKPALGLGLLLEQRNRLQFVHDKVQEAALAAIPAERRRAIHRQVGSHLLTAVPRDADLERIENLFTIVSHLNLGREDAPTPESAHALSDINYHAGNKALTSLATEAANEYFSLSLSLLPDDCWDADHYERTFRIFQKAAKTELMCGNYERSERLLSRLLDHAASDLDKAECLAEQTTSLSSIGNFSKAIETANRGLAYFHKNIPESPEEADARRTELMTEIAMQGDVWQTILNMPFTRERQRKIELAFYSELIPDLYMSGLVPQLYLSAAQSTQLCLAGGMDESVIYSFSIMGLQLGEQEKFDLAFRYEDLARGLSAAYPNTFGATRGMNGIVWCNMHSRSHPRQIVDYALKAIQCGKSCGDLYNAGLSYGPLMWNLQIQGGDLALIEEYTRECLHFSRRYHLSFSVGLAEAMQAGWVAPMQNGYTVVAMEDRIRQWEQDNHVASAGSYFVHLALTHYYFGEHDQAQASLDEVQKYLSGLTDNVLKRQWYVFRVLNALRKFTAAGRDSEAWDLLMTRLRPLIEKIETWATLGPLLKPYLALLYAELERSRGNFREARGLYLDAIDAAHKEQYVFLEGYLHECLGNLLIDSGHSSEYIYFAEAARLYRQCGAQRKELSLREQHPEYFKERRRGYTHFEPDYSAALPNLDVDYLMKSSLAISAEIVQDSLLEKIMNVVIESSGAQHGYLLMLDNGSLFVRAESHVTGNLAVRTMDQHLDDTEEICKSIVRYVQRTGERVILDSASREGMFKDNPEVQELCLRSVLCLPVIRQSIMTGVLYLENRLSEAVFTPDKAQMTELLTSQAAISMENARLLDEMKNVEEALGRARDELEQRVAARTAELEEQSRILESFFKHTKTGFVFLDTNFNFIRINESYARSCQRGIGDFTGRNHFELYPSDELKGRFQHVVETGEPFYAYERPFTFPDHPEWGTSYWDLAVSPILNAQQHIECLVFTLNDVTERRRVADELQDKNQLLLQQSRQAAMGEMINNIAHQWRQPLNTLGLYTQRLGLFYGSPRFSKEFLDMSVAKSMEIIKHMSKTIDDFRNYFKPDKEMNTFAVIDMIENTLSLLEGSLQNPKITIDIVAQDTPVITGYQNEFAQVILNILINARDALMEKNIEDARVTITICSEDGCAVVTIADNAGGIPEQIVDKIFDPYFTTKGPDKGTGVGLFMSKAIIEKNMNGRLTVRNTAEGAEFRIEV